MGLYDEFKQNKISAYGVPARIMVIGVGGAGGNTVDHIFELGIKGVNLMICNTDSKALNKSPLEPSQKICMGDGKGAGNDAIVGQQKAKESLAEIRQYVESHNPDLIFLTAGMGGGTGTGAAPVIAQMIHALNIPTIAILTTPSENEGIHRFEQAMVGIRSMRELVDTFIIIKNETIIELSEERSVHEAFNMANDIVAYASKGIAEIALTQSDLVSVDISDVCKVVRNSRYAVMGMASESGEDRVIKAIKSAVLSPLFGNVSISGSRNVLINISVSSSDGLTLNEAHRVRDRVQHHAKSEDENGNVRYTNIIWGVSIKPNLAEDEMEVVVVATGFNNDGVSGPIVIKNEEPEDDPIIVDTTPQSNDGEKEEKEEVRPAMPKYRSVPAPIARPSRNFAEIEECKRVPAYIAHGRDLTTATKTRSVGSTDRDEAANDPNMPMLF